MEKMRRARYTLEYKLEALRLIGAGQSIATVAATLGLADQTVAQLHSKSLRNQPQFELNLRQFSIANGAEIPSFIRV